MALSDSSEPIHRTKSKKLWITIFEFLETNSWHLTSLQHSEGTQKQADNHIKTQTLETPLERVQVETGTQSSG